MDPNVGSLITVTYEACMLTTIQAQKLICGMSQDWWKKVARIQAPPLSLQLKRRKELATCESIEVETDSVFEQLKEEYPDMENSKLYL